MCLFKKWLLKDTKKLLQIEALHISMFSDTAVTWCYINVTWLQKKLGNISQIKGGNHNQRYMKK